MCLCSGPTLLPALKGMGMLKFVFMSALSSSSSTQMGEVGLGEVMDKYPWSVGMLSLVDLLSKISGAISFELWPRSPGWGLSCG